MPSVAAKKRIERWAIIFQFFIVDILTSLWHVDVGVVGVVGFVGVVSVVGNVSVDVDSRYKKSLAWETIILSSGSSSQMEVSQLEEDVSFSVCTSLCVALCLSLCLSLM